MMLLALAALALAQPDWTWSLYDGQRLVLANEIIDTPQLRATLECEPGSGAISVVLFGPTLAGPATVTSGAATTTATARGKAQGGFELTLNARSAVLQAFAAGGKMTVRVADQTRSIDMGDQGLPLLRRFAQQCGG